MEVSVSALRAELKSWIERARAGEDIVVTDRGVPVARLTGVATADLLTELTREGLVTPPTADRPTAGFSDGEDTTTAATAATAGAARTAAPGAARGAGRGDGARPRSSGVAGLVRRIRR